MAREVTLDGVPYTVHPEDGGVLVLRPVTTAPVEAHNSPLRGMADPDRPYIRPVTTRSALVRIWHENRMVIAVITHCTDRAVRIVAPEGAAWLPKNVMEYASTSKNPEGFFCVTADDYVPVFVSPSQSMSSTVEDTCGAWEIYSEEFILLDTVNVPNDENREE